MALYRIAVTIGLDTSQNCTLFNSEIYTDSSAWKFISNQPEEDLPHFINLPDVLDVASGILFVND